MRKSEPLLLALEKVGERPRAAVSRRRPRRVEATPGHRHGRLVEEEHPLTRRTSLAVLGHNHAALHLVRKDTEQGQQQEMNGTGATIGFASHIALLWQ